MKLLPRKLLSRLLLLIALLLAISIYASLKIFDYFDREPRATMAALQAVTIVNYTRASLIAAHEDRRLALLSELTGREGVRVYAADFMEDIEPIPNDPFIQMVAQKIRERLGEETIITVNHYGIAGLWISLTWSWTIFGWSSPKFRSIGLSPGIGCGGAQWWAYCRYLAHTLSLRALTDHLIC